MKAYSLDLRERILRDCDRGMGTRDVATKYDVSESWVRRLKQRRRETGEVAPRRAGSRRPQKWLAHTERLQQLVAERPDATLQELREQLGLPLSLPTLWRALRALRLTFKKKSSMRPSRTDPTSTSGARPGKPR
jgi:transposase